MTLRVSCYQHTRKVIMKATYDHLRCMRRVKMGLMGEPHGHNLTSASLCLHNVGQQPASDGRSPEIVRLLESRSGKFSETSARRCWCHGSQRDSSQNIVSIPATDRHKCLLSHRWPVTGGSYLYSYICDDVELQYCSKRNLNIDALWYSNSWKTEWCKSALRKGDISGGTFRQHRGYELAKRFKLQLLIYPSEHSLCAGRPRWVANSCRCTSASAHSVTCITTLFEGSVTGVWTTPKLQLSLYTDWAIAASCKVMGLLYHTCYTQRSFLTGWQVLSKSGNSPRFV